LGVSIGLKKKPNHLVCRVVLPIILFALPLFSQPLFSVPILTTEEIQARMILEALRRAYPDRVEGVEWKDGDWTIQIRGDFFYWAHGRLLPPKARDRWSDYRPYVFYTYPQEPNNPATFSKEKIEALRKQGDSESRQRGLDHQLSFQAALYGGSTRAVIEDHLVQVSLFGKSVSVHERIQKPLQRINQRILELSKTSTAVAEFLRGIKSIDGYNWREIRGTQRKSFHSWGLAVDILPKKLEGKAIYWEWERERNENWMILPLQERWTPPATVIEAFEAEGFIWGGKWDLYDDMHFEYRPELFEIRKIFSAVGGIDPLRSLWSR
jgi:hypothetical protein